MIAFVDDLGMTIQDRSSKDKCKAFDTVHHDIILQKLKYQYIVNGTMLNFVRSYLQNRTRCVVIQAYPSDTFDSMS